MDIPSPLMVWSLALVALALGLHMRRVERGAGPRPVVPPILRAVRAVPVPPVLIGRAGGERMRSAPRGCGARADPRACRSCAQARLALTQVGLVAGAGIAIANTGLGVVSALVLGIAGYAGPARWVIVRGHRRRRAIMRELPDFIDLVVICAESGMALDGAIRIAAERLPGELASEISATLRELDLGTPRREAYEALSEPARRACGHRARRVAPAGGGARFADRFRASPTSRAHPVGSHPGHARPRGPRRAKGAARRRNDHGARGAPGHPRGHGHRARRSDRRGRGRRAMTQRGSAGADYLAVIAVVGIVFAGLLVMRPQRVGPKSPGRRDSSDRPAPRPPGPESRAPAGRTATTCEASGAAAQAGDTTARERPRRRAPARMVAERAMTRSRSATRDAGSLASGHTRVQWDLERPDLLAGLASPCPRCGAPTREWIRAHDRTGRPDQTGPAMHRLRHRLHQPAPR